MCLIICNGTELTPNLILCIFTAGAARTPALKLLFLKAGVKFEGERVGGSYPAEMR